ncbi:MAG: alpha-glucan family phosphorylase, partial [Gammaproteobacteria bacterium]
NDPSYMPVLPVRTGDGEWLSIELDFPDRTLRLRAWQASVGRVNLYLLDSNDPLNDPADRGITSELYGGGTELRIQQEIVLGIGGYRLLRALGQAPQVCHLNEGHAAFVVLERARDFAQTADVDFTTALTATRAGNLFTTHTPVDAGFDRFAPALLEKYLAGWAQQAGIGMEDLLALGRPPGTGTNEPFNMAWLGIHGSGAVNGVSRLHGEVSRHLFQGLFPRWPVYEVPVAHVTNGVHIPSWDSPAADRLWTEACGKDRWRDELQALEAAIDALSDEQLWAMRTENRNHLVQWIRSRRAHQQVIPGDGAGLLDPNTLTLGFARRFATYKRPALLLHDRDRLHRLLTRHDRPVQLVLAGKAHPKDRDGQRMLREWIQFIRDYGLGNHVVFVADYDLLTAARLVGGVDLWLNTPRRPWEACGTSGMKVLVNGGLNLSELDGWWAEAWTPEVGWALGDGREHDEQWDAHEATQLYDLLERQVVPAFYDRDAQGIPTRWTAMMRRSMATLTPAFSSNRMVRQYTQSYYLPMAQSVSERCADGAALAKAIAQWNEGLYGLWDAIRFGSLMAGSDDREHRVTVQVYLDGIDPDDVRVQLYADPLEGSEPECHDMVRGQPLAGAVNGYLYEIVLPPTRPLGDYTVRVVPHHPLARVPLENNLILWQR